MSNVVHLAELKAEAGEYSNITPGLHLCSDREKDKDEGLPSETEEDRRHQENRAKEIRGEQPMFQFCAVVGGESRVMLSVFAFVPDSRASAEEG